MKTYTPKTQNERKILWHIVDFVFLYNEEKHNFSAYALKNLIAKGIVQYVKEEGFYELTDYYYNDPHKRIIFK